MKPVLIRVLIVAVVLGGMVAWPAAADSGRRWPVAARTVMRQVTPTPRPPMDPTPAAPQTPAVPDPQPPQPMPTPTPGVPGVLPETGVTPQPDGPLTETYDENLTQNLGRLESYRYETTITWDLDVGRSGEADIVTEIVNRPSAQRWEVTLTEDNRPAESFGFIRVGRQTFMRTEGQWLAVMPEVQILLTRFAWMVEPQRYLDLTEGRFFGVEEVNGIEAERYRYTSAAFEAVGGPIDIEGARADLWIDRERDILARVRMLLVGNDPLGGSGAYTVNSSLVSVDEAITIEAPVVPAPEELPPTGETELILAEALRLPMFDTYRLTGTFRWDLETGQRGDANFDVEVDQRRPAERAVMDVGQGLFRISFEYVNLEGAAYIRRGNQWIPARQFAVPALLQQLGWIGDPRAFVMEGEGRLVGRETINGIETEHYVFEREALGSLPFLVEIDDAEVEAWYAPEHDAYVRLRVRVEGVDNRDVRGEYELESDVTDINEPITIERPAGFPEE